MENGAKPRDLEDRTFAFAESVRVFVKKLRCLDWRGSRIGAHLFVDHLEKRVMTTCFFDFGILSLLGIWSLGFENL
jgi:hypothetical protein